MKKFKILPFNFCLFDGGDGAGAATGTAEGSANGQNSGDAGQNAQQTTQPAAEVSTGAEQKVESPTPEDLRKRYNEFMADENMKKFANDDTQKVINRRFKETKQLQSQIAAQNEILDKFYSKYNVDNLQDLSNAVDNDDALWEDAAADMGMTVENYKQFKAMERQSQRANEYIQQMQAQRQAQEQWMALQQEAETVKQAYPDFDLERECQDERFKSLIDPRKQPSERVSMQLAYEVCHMNDIKSSIAKATAQNTEKAVTDNIRAKGQRPQEGAVTNQAAVSTVTDVSKLTREQRAKIAQEALRGKTITFR